MPTPDEQQILQLLAKEWAYKIKIAHEAVGLTPP